jgi:phospholipase C
MKQVRMKQVRNVLIAGCVLAVSCAWGQSSPDSATITPIKYVVVVFDENNSFDHYFGTYPTALNPDGEPAFHAAAGTPAANGLTPRRVSTL